MTSGLDKAREAAAARRAAGLPVAERMTTKSPDDAVCRFGDSIAGQTDHFEVWVERDGDERARVRGPIETITRTTWRNA